MALRRSYPSFLGGGRRAERQRVLAQKRVITISEPMTVVETWAPDLGFDTLYATDVAQRLYTLDGFYGRSVEIDGAVYTAAAGAEGGAPIESDTWSEVAASRLGPKRGHLILWERLARAEYASAAYIGLWTSVFQDCGLWRGPFTVVHELWVNARRWRKIYKDENVVLDLTDNEKIHQKSRKIGGSSG